MKKVLVAIPYKPGLLPVFRGRMMDLSRALVEANPDFDIEIVMRSDAVDTSGPYASPQAIARNALLDNHLRLDHDYVLWIDADLVDYPADILAKLQALNPDGVTAPVVLIEGTNQFYDTYGYREIGGACVIPWPPYFKRGGDAVTLGSVGCIYLIPASIYQEGYRYFAIDGHTEHESIMQVARACNLPIICDTTQTAYHADLPKYGLDWHGH